MNEKLKQLVMEVKQSPPLTEERQQVIKELVERMLLPLNSIFPSLRGQFNSETQIAIYKELQEKLNHDLERDIEVYNLQNPSIEQWTKELLNKASIEILNENYLQRLALEVQKYKPRSREWQYAIHALTNAILLSKKLLRKKNISEEIYKEATNELWLWVYKNINKYNPSKGKFMAWINYRFDNILRETKTSDRDPLIQGIKSKIMRTKYQLKSQVKNFDPEDLKLWWNFKKLIPDNSTIEQINLILLILFLLSKLMTIDTLVTDKILYEIAKQSQTISDTLGTSEEIETIPQPEVEESPSEKLRQYIREDPHGLLQKHIKKHPEATFQIIALYRLDGKTLREISETLNIGIPTINNFFQRYLKNIAPEIKKYFED